jgi:uncharacterized membrane protein
MALLKSFGLAAVAYTILDFIWLGYVVKDFNLRQLAGIGRIKDGDFAILYTPAVGAYILMALAVAVFVVPRAENSLSSAAIYGALMGLIMYGVFDLTNMAILKDYPLPFMLADMACGVAVSAIVSVITVKFTAT